MKTAGLDAEQLRRTHPPSAMTLGGMVKHLALCEVSWFANRFAGGGEGEPWDSVDWAADPDWDWHSADRETPVLHMIEEYARHNGHADLIREALDGATGE